ncbi:Endonuclease MutS2 [anaerobic digester metagenome]
MNLGKAIQKHDGLRYIAGLLQLHSPGGRHRMLNQPFYTNAADLTREFDLIEAMVKCIENTGNQNNVNNIVQGLMQLHDIRGTLNNTRAQHVLDDIELFELKRFALISDQILGYLEKMEFRGIYLPGLDKIIELLDPEGHRTPHFFIYPAYSDTLKTLREQFKSFGDVQSEEAMAVYHECIEIEDSIRKELSSKLWPLYNDISTAWEGLAALDFLMARAQLAIDHKWVKAEVSEEITAYKGLFHPRVKAVLEKEKRSFQPWDIKLYSAPTLITGANMAGKTVLLKTVALNQYLFQFGFYVAADAAEIAIVEDIMAGIGDEQSELSGLSSFAAEMLNIQSIIHRARAGCKLLVLIDEPARTTNPHEGIAIANALIDVLEQLGVRSLVTTHYSGLHTACRKLRVKGLRFPKGTESITVENINRFMDYSLLEHSTDEVPREALQIAHILQVDPELLQRARAYADQNEKTL